METLKKGSRGEVVKRLQEILHLVPDGIFGPLTEEAVKSWQKENGLTPDGIVGIKTWAKLLPLNYTRSKRRIDEIIVHCTATREGCDYPVEMIDKQHKAQGWSGIGYHYVVYLDGSVHRGRDIDKVGAHCAGHNSYSIGVCYVGGCDKNMRPKDTRTAAQKAALVDLLKTLKRLHPTASIHGHREYANKACPSFDARTEYKYI